MDVRAANVTGGLVNFFLRTDVPIFNGFKTYANEIRDNAWATCLNVKS